MECDGQYLRKVCEILVGCEDREVTSGGDRADQEVGVRALHAFRSAQVEERRGLFVVLSGDLDVAKGRR
jgi:hypothetical protein